MLPTSLERGQSAVVNIRAYDGHGVATVQLDLREYGGEIINMTSEDGSEVWAAMVEMPAGMNPVIAPSWSWPPTNWVQPLNNASTRLQTMSEVLSSGRITWRAMLNWQWKSMFSTTGLT